jgi:hypothetical protein
MTKPGLPTKTRVPGHKPSSLPRVDRKRARVFLGAVADTGSGTRARLSLSFLSIAQERKGRAEAMLCDARAVVYTLQMWCLSVCSSQTFADCGQGSRLGGPSEVSRPFIHAVWGQTVRSVGQTGVHKARWAGQTGLGSVHKTCRGASQCPKVTGTH